VLALGTAGHGQVSSKRGSGHGDCPNEELTERWALRRSGLDVGERSTKSVRKWGVSSRVHLDLGTDRLELR
jgi:hypothetical protein